MRIPSGVTDQYIYFVAVDSTDYITRETGLSSFTVYRSRNGAAAAAMTTPTINETSSANMPGVYELLLDEDMTIGSGNDSEEMVFHITATGMSPVTRTIELYRSKITAGNTLGTGADGDLLEVNTLTGHTAQTGDNYARLGAPAGASVSADIATIDSNVDAILVDTNELQTNQGNWLTATGFSTHTAANVRTEIDTNSTQLAAIVADTNELQTDDVPGLIAALNDISAADVNAQVDTALNDIHLDHLFATDYDPATKPGAATALLNELVENDAGVSRFTANALEEAPTGGSAPTVTEIRTEIDTNSTQLAAIVADTNELQTNQGNWLTATGFSTHTAANVRTEIDTNSTQLAAIVADTNELQTDDVPGLIAALNDISAADVNAEMVDVLTVDTIADSYAADGAQPTLSQAILAIQQFLTDKQVSGTTVTVRKPDGTTAAMTFTLDDGTTPTSITRAS